MLQGRDGKLHKSITKGHRCHPRKTRVTVGDCGFGDIHYRPLKSTWDAADGDE